MRPLSDDSMTGEIFDDRAPLTVEELSRLCSVDRTYIVELVEEGVLSVTEVESEWRFPGGALRRARMAMRLQRDLEVNLPGVALAFQLMEELDELRRQLNAGHR